VRIQFDRCKLKNNLQSKNSNTFINNKKFILDKNRVTTET